MKKLRILLISDNLVRELEALRVLKKTLEKTINSQVNIFGSLADWEVIYFKLNEFRPHLVFLTQVQEQKCRDLAEYIKSCGAKICVIPPETTVVQALKDVFINPKLKYDQLLDFLFLPGKALFEFYKKSDIEQSKIFLTGSPKIDAFIQAKGEQFYSRERFLEVFNVPKGRKNIFIFSSFRNFSMDYIEKDIGYKGVTEIAGEESEFIEKTSEEYLKLIPEFCNQFADCNIILKPHPLEDQDRYNSIESPNFYVIQKSTLQNCLKSIDLAIHWNSTIAAECWLFGIKTVQYSPIKKLNFLLSDLYKGNPLFVNYKTFVQGVRKYLNENLDNGYLDFQKKYLKINYGDITESASAKIADIISKKISIENIRLSYKKNSGLRYFLFKISEKTLGKYLSRRTLHFFDKNYRWKYSTENYVDE